MVEFGDRTEARDGRQAFLMHKDGRRPQQQAERDDVEHGARTSTQVPERG